MKHIVKIAANNVEVTSPKKVTSTAGVEVEIYEGGTKVSYGQKRINEHKARCDADLKEAKALDERQYKTDLIARRKADADKISALRVIVPLRTTTDIKGNTVEVFDCEGEDHFEELVHDAKVCQKLLIEAKALDTRQYKADLIKKAQAEVDEIDAIQAEMDK